MFEKYRIIYSIVVRSILIFARPNLVALTKELQVVESIRDSACDIIE